MDCNNDDKHNEPTPHPTESETIESWTFLGDDSTNTTHPGTILGNENIIDHHDDDTKSSSKTSRSSSSCISENLLSVTNPGIDGDISDGISVISDCDSIQGRHSPMPPAKNRSLKLSDDDMDATDRMKTSRVEEVDSYTLVERSTENEMEELNRHQDSQRHYVWNPSNIILFGLIIGAAAILSSQCWRINLSHEALMPEVSLLAQRIQDLESENLALKVEVSRLVDLHHAGHDHPHSNEKVFAQRPIKGKKVWTGADEAPIHIPKHEEKEYYCDDEHLNSDDLFSSYNVKKCGDRNSVKMEMDQRPTSKDDSDYDNLTIPMNDSETETRKKKNSNKDNNASNKREKFAESKVKHFDNQKLSSETDENTRNEKFVKIQEERQKLYDEAREKYLERQKKKEKKQEKDKKNRGDVLKDQKTSRKQPKDTDSEWYDKMMKQREELRNSGRTKEQNKENWYIERANEREKVRGKHEKQSKSKQYR